ncbi:hypothetical protein GWI33_002794, partial [Rhynchophorus ferrugineus]
FELNGFVQLIPSPILYQRSPIKQPSDNNHVKSVPLSIKFKHLLSANEVLSATYHPKRSNGLRSLLGVKEKKADRRDLSDADPAGRTRTDHRPICVEKVAGNVSRGFSSCPCRAAGFGFATLKVEAIKRNRNRY